MEDVAGGANSGLSPLDFVELFRGFVGKNGRTFVIFDGGQGSGGRADARARRLPTARRAEPLLACLPCNLTATRSADHWSIASEGERHGTPSIAPNFCLRSSAACSG